MAVDFDTCLGVTCDTAPTILTAPPTEIRMRSVKNNDDICLLIEVHHMLLVLVLLSANNCQLLKHVILCLEIIKLIRFVVVKRAVNVVLFDAEITSRLPFN